MNPPRESIESATSFYNRLLVDEHVVSTREAVSKLNQDPRVGPAGGNLCRWLRPTFVARGFHDRGSADGLAVVRALHRAADALRDEPAMCKLLRLEDSLGWRLFVDHGVPGVRVNGRLDGLPTRDGRLMFAEYNTNLTGGMVHSEVFPRALHSMPIMEAFRERFDTTISGQPGMASMALRRAHEEAGGTGAPCFYVVFGGTGGQALDIEAYEAMMTLQQMSPSDVEVLVGVADGLEYVDGHLWAKDRRVDVLYAPDDQWPSIFAKFGLQHALFGDAIPNGRVRILNGASLGGLVAEKSMFELLSRPDLSHLYDADTRAALARAVPWTRMVAPRFVDHHGRREDLLELARTRQSTFVLKPTNEEGGSGVVLGWAVDSKTWHRALEAALEQPHVLQERVDIQQQPFPTWNGAAVEVVPCRYSVDLFVWNDASIAGAISRVSPNEMLNVAGDAAPNAVFVLEGVDR